MQQVVSALTMQVADRDAELAAQRELKGQLAARIRELESQQAEA